MKDNVHVMNKQFSKVNLVKVREWIVGRMNELNRFFFLTKKCLERLSNVVLHELDMLVLK